MPSHNIQYHNFKGYLGNSQLKRCGVKIEWTPDMVEEYLKCSMDPIYFAENHMKIVNVDKGLMTIKLYDYQKQIVNTAKDHRYTVAECSRQAGKCLEYNTRINIRNKTTGEIHETTIGEFYDLQKRLLSEKQVQDS